ncbi:MAG: alpha/beta hydrolase [Dehalococcoidia bacterium]|nr:alpha/beta hydrolase [Dehalococcoidia bacterium]
MKHELGFAEVNGAQIRYEMMGSGHLVVLIHGHTLDQRMWERQFEPFAASFQVLQYDMRGYGRSSLPDGDYSLTADLQALLKQLKVKRAHVVGLSLGGGVALDFALAFPEMIAGLVLVDSTLPGRPWSTDFGDVFPLLSRAGRAGDVAGARRIWGSHGLFAPAMDNPAVAPAMEAMLAAYTGWHWQNRNPAHNKTEGIPAALGRVAAPSLVVVGERDLPEFHQIAADLVRGIPNARFLMIPDAGHMAPMEAPQAFNGAVMGFLKGLK